MVYKMALDPILIRTSQQLKEIVLDIIHPLKGTELEKKLAEFETNQNNLNYNKALEREIRSAYPTLDFLFMNKIKPLVQEIADNEKTNELLNCLSTQGGNVLGELISLIEDKPNPFLNDNLEVIISGMSAEDFKVKHFLLILHNALNVDPNDFNLK